MPDINEVERLFFEAMGQPEQDRQAFLQHRCEDNQALYAEVESLLSHVPRVSPEFLYPPELTLSAQEIRGILDEEDDEAPAYVGPYRVLEQIAEGGMGVVYRAEQTEPIKRTVAVKVLRFGINRSRSVARFRVEQQALAVMQHPSIARIFDAGVTDDGHPFIAMEFIAGAPITKFCADSTLSLRECVELFIQACEAIQHAHQKGVIHRDIKPANVLVTTEEDGAPRVKIIDFSIAKPTQTISALSARTQHGEVLGSLNYMAPEQLSGTEDVDTRADIYALGALLYEMLSGCRAIEWNPLARNSSESVTRATASPLAPSARLKLSARSRTTSDESTNVRQARWMPRQLRGDLDCIVLKTLELDRSKRYGTAAELGADLRRCLNEEPISASPPSVLYNARKFVARHRTGVIAVAIIAAVLVLSLVGVTSQALRATRARRAELDNGYIASIAAANSAIEARDLANAQRFLEMAPITHRGWEWHHLLSRLDSCATVVTTGGPVFAISLDRRSTTLALAGPAGIELLDAHSQQRLAHLGESLGTVQTVEMSPDGQMVAAGTFDGTIVVWHTHDQKQIHSLAAAHGSILSVALSTDGDWLAAASADGSVRVWNVHTFEPLHEWNAGACGAIEFMPDSLRLAVASDDCSVRIYDITSARLISTHPTSADCRPISLAVNHDGSMLAVGERKGCVRVWNIEGQRELEKLVTDGGDVFAVAFSGDGRYFACGTRDRAIRCWDVASWRAKPVFLGHTQAITSLAINSDGSRLFSGSPDQTVRIWHDIGEETPRSGVLARLDDRITSADVSRNGLTMVAATRTNVVLLRPDSRDQAVTFTPDAGYPTAVAVSAQGDRVAVAIGKDVVFFDDPWTLATRMSQESAAADITCMHFSPDGSLLATAAGREMLIWNVQSGAMIRTLTGPPKIVRAIAFSPLEDRLAAAFDDGSLWLFDLRPTAIPIALCAEGSRIAALAFDHTGRTLASAEAEAGVITLWNVEDRERIADLPVGSGTSSLAFSTTGDRVLVGTKTGEIQVWRVDTKDLILCLWHHRDWVASLDVCQDGRAFSASADGSIRVWNTRAAPSSALMGNEQR